MAQSLSSVLLHIVFSTKDRRRWISGTVRPALHAYLAGACRGMDSSAFRVGGVDDHVHIACSLPRTLSVSSLVGEIKRSSSSWMKTQGECLAGFTWQGGYGAFSVGESQLPDLLHYIDRQHEHHRRVSFQEEFVRLLDLYGIEYDEKHLWT